MRSNNDHTTTLLEVRRFLQAQSAAPAPWTEPSKTLDALYALLSERRDDAVFWYRLHDLVQRLQDHRVNLSTLANSEALGYATLQKLLDDLRADLGEDKDKAGPSWKRALLSSLRATSVAAFLLLGTATASCEEEDDAETDTDAGADADTDSDSDIDSDADTDSDTDADADSDTDVDTDSDSDTGELCPEAIENNISGDEGLVYCDLIDAINKSSLSADEKADLFECLPILDADYREHVLNDFETLSDDELSAHLHGDLFCICFVDSDDDCH